MQIEAITWGQFFIIFAICAITILICRVVPLFALKGRELPKKLQEALELIPPAAFAALVANDLFTPGMFDGGLWPAAAPLVASIFVIIIARFTRSLLWSAIVGVAAYALLMMI